MTVPASAKKNTVDAIIAMEMIQKEIATPSPGDRKASSGLATGFVVDIGAPMAASVPMAWVLAQKAGQSGFELGCAHK